MSRIRTIKPEFWTSEQVMTCSPSARLLFIGLWNFSDDAGVHPCSIVRLKAEIFPGDDVQISKIQDWVNELLNNDLIQEYTIDGKKYWIVTGWSKHQRIDKPTYKYPLPTSKNNNKINVFNEKNSNSNQIQVIDYSDTIPIAFDEHSNTEWKGMERNGKECNGKDEVQIHMFNSSVVEPKSVSSPSFKKFWKAYPRRQSKKKAEDVWKRKKLDKLIDVILEDLAQRTDWNAGSQFTPLPTTYLNGERWQDEEKNDRKDIKKPNKSPADILIEKYTLEEEVKNKTEKTNET